MRRVAELRLLARVVRRPRRLRQGHERAQLVQELEALRLVVLRAEADGDDAGLLAAYARRRVVQASLVGLP